MKAISVRRRLAFLLLLSLCLPQLCHGYSLEIRIAPGRAAHSFSIVSDSGVGSWSHAGLDPSGAFASGTFSSETESGGPPGEQFYLYDQTAGDYLPLNSVFNGSPPGDLSSATWLTGADTSSQPSTRRYFVVESSRAADNFLLHSAAGVFYPVTVSSASGFAEASALVDPGYDYTLVDVTTREQLATNTHNGLNGYWSGTNLPIPFVNVFAIVPDGRAGALFIFRSGGYFTSSSAAAAPMEALGGQVRTVVTATLPMQAAFSLELDGVPESAVTSNTGFPPAPYVSLFDFSGAFPLPPDPDPDPDPPLPGRWGYYVFSVGQNHQGETFYVTFGQQNAQASPTGVTGALTTWDDFGQRIDYAYAEHQAWVDLDLVSGITSSAGTTDPMDGFQAWHPAPPAGYLNLNLAEWRRSHEIWLQQADGTRWRAHFAPGYESQTYYYDTGRLVFAGTPEERTVSLSFGYAILQVPFDPAQGFTIIDESTRDDQNGIPPDTVSFAVAPGASLSLEQWGVSAPTVFPIDVTICATRAGHQLELRTSYGDSFPLGAGTAQGFWSGAGAQFIPYYYFQESSYARDGYDWWIYDHHTGTSSPLNQNDYTSWHSEDAHLDADGDSLPDWYERYILHTSTESSPAAGAQRPAGWDSDGDGLSDGEEVLLGTNPKAPAVRDSSRLILTIFTPTE